jgi:hypothetical protein
MPLRAIHSTYIRILTLILFLASVAAHAEPRILASGPPALTAEMGDKLAVFYQWALDIRFTADQKREFDNFLANDWADASKRKSTLTLLDLTKKLVTLPEDSRKQAQATLNRELIGETRKSTGDPQSAWLLAIYDTAHSAAAEEKPAATTDIRPGTADRRLIGKWRAGSVAATQYYNAYTGAPAPTSGSTFSYEFLPDGTYRMNGLLQITTYGCTSSVWRDHSGTYRVEGNRLYIQPAQGIVKSHVCGGKEQTKEDKRELEVHTYHFESDTQGENLVLGSSDGKSRPDTFRRQK